uniref:Inositol polyphosphate 1-phosphatase n=1 Tax=Trichobilharzia regenti TaxID=157069 RepID=A0AA85JNT7_TRIRE|nr:unnamed protein product [Trichobilharzia regenti]
MPNLARQDPLCVQLLKSLILCSEKAAVIARLIKKQTNLFQSLIQVKDSSEANLRFSIDVKTLADVLIQEVIKYDLNLLFPGFGESVFGEENNRFSSNSGKSVTIQLTTKENLVNLLVDVFGNNEEFANELSEICFQPLEWFKTQLPVCKIWEHLIESCNNCFNGQQLNERFNDPGTFGVWIDPIDSTADYAQGRFDKIQASITPPTTVSPTTTTNPPNSSSSSPPPPPPPPSSVPPSQSAHIASSPVTQSATDAEHLNQINHFFENPTSLIRFYRGGLINVTILIGLFDRCTGVPLIGVINQPFYLIDLSESEVDTFPNYGRIFWGIHVMNLETNSLIINSRSNNCCSQALMNSPPGNLQYPRHLRFPDNFFDVLCPDRVFSEGKPILKLACSSVEFSRLTNLFHDYRDENLELVNVVLLSSSGAGFKQLCVILDEVDAFILMEPNTFVWDTCGPHTIISSLGGGIIQLKSALESVKASIQSMPNHLDSVRQIILNNLFKFQITYNKITKSTDEIQTVNSSNLSKCCNRQGLLVYRNPMLASQILVHIALNQK